MYRSENAGKPSWMLVVQEGDLWVLSIKDRADERSPNMSDQVAESG